MRGRGMTLLDKKKGEVRKGHRSNPKTCPVEKKGIKEISAVSHNFPLGLVYLGIPGRDSEILVSSKKKRRRAFGALFSQKSETGSREPVWGGPKA